MPKLLEKQEWNIYQNIILGNDKNDYKKRLIALYGIDAENEEGTTCLLAACKENNIPVIEFLLQNQANVNHADKSGCRPLFFAAHSSPVTVQLLLNYQADVNFISPVDVFNYSPLAAAAIEGHVAIVQLLLEHGADPNLIGSHLGDSPLYNAATKSRCDIIKLLLQPKYKANPNILTSAGETALVPAIQNKDIKTIKLLLEHKVNPNIKFGNGSTIIHKLVKETSRSQAELTISILELLIQHHADFNYSRKSDQYTPLLLAIFQGNLPLVDYFLKKQSTLSLALPPQKVSPKKSELLYAIDFANQGILTEIKIIERLINDVNTNISDSCSLTTPLHAICHCKADPDFAKQIIKLLLLKNDGNINYQIPPHKLTPLHIAFGNKKNGEKIINYLLSQKNIDIHAKGEQGLQAIHLAAEVNFNKILKRLIKMKADINARLEDNTTPLFQAAQEGHAEIVKTLLELGAAPEIRRNDDTSALFIAYQEKHLQVVNILMECFYKKQLNLASDSTYEVVADILLPKYNFQAITFGFFSPVKQIADLCPKEPLSNYDNSDDLNCLSPSLETGYSFLLKHGFSKESIKQMRQKKFDSRKENKHYQPIIMESVEKQIITWADGAITSAMQKIVPIESGNSKTPHCYLLIDNENLQTQNCENLEKFTELRPIFCAQKEEQGIKKLSGDFKIEIKINDNIYMSRITHELKIKNSPARVLCCTLLSDDRKHTLYIAAIYRKKGLHSAKAVENLQQSSNILAIKVPEDEKPDKIASLTLSLNKP